jgi:hypothetical protein
MTTTSGRTFPVLARVSPEVAQIDIFSPPAGAGDVISHLDQLSSNEMNARLLWIAIGASGRSTTVCMVFSRVDGSNLTLPECGRYPRILKALCGSCGASAHCLS